MQLFSFMPYWVPPAVLVPVHGGATLLSVLFRHNWGCSCIHSITEGLSFLFVCFAI